MPVKERDDLCATPRTVTFSSMIKVMAAPFKMGESEVDYEEMKYDFLVPNFPAMEMPAKIKNVERKRCCCTCSLRTGVLFIALFQLLSISVWIFQIIQVMSSLTEESLKTFPQTVIIGLVNVFFTLTCSFSNFVGYLMNDERLLLVASALQVLLTASMLVSSILLFFARIWIYSFVAITLSFFYSYFLSVIYSYKIEIKQIRNFKRLSAETDLSMRY